MLFAIAAESKRSQSSAVGVIIAGAASRWTFQDSRLTTGVDSGVMPASQLII